MLQKAKRARDQSAAAKAECQDALEEAEKSKRLTKNGQKDSEQINQNLQCKDKMLKQIMVKKDKSMALKKAKECLVDATSSIKAVKEEAKELRMMANKASSKSSLK